MPTLRFAEEILLLLLDDRSGRFAHVIESSLRCAIAGAVLVGLMSMFIGSFRKRERPPFRDQGRRW